MAVNNLFVDRVGSTALAARLDPEDLTALLGSYRRTVSEVAEKFGEFGAKYMGDGVLIYFGYPQAHEDDTERAIRCGLAGQTGRGAVLTEFADIRQ